MIKLNGIRYDLVLVGIAIALILGTLVYSQL